MSSARAASSSAVTAASLAVRSSASARAASSSGFSRAARRPALRGLGSLRHLVGADLRALRPGGELGDEPLGAFGAIGELVQTGVLFLDPAGQLRRSGLGGFGPSLGSADLRRELHALDVPRLDLRRELRGPGLRPVRHLASALGRSGLGPLARRPSPRRLVPSASSAAALLLPCSSTPSTPLSRLLAECACDLPRARRPSWWRPAATSGPRRARSAPRRTARRDPSGRPSPSRAPPSRPRARG